MNRSVAFPLSIFSLIMSLYLAVPVSAMDYIIGAKGGYFVWEPFFKDIYHQDVKNGTGALFGPILGIAFTPDLTVSVSGLFGEQSSHWDQGNSYRPERQRYESGTSYMEAFRYDIDTALSYRVLTPLRVFIGYKYQRLDYSLIQSDRKVYDSDPTNIRSSSDEMIIDVERHGPALGFNVTMPLTRSFFFSMTFSGLYSVGTFEFEERSRIYESTTAQEAQFGTEEPVRTFSFDVREYGINLEPVLGVQVESVIINLGLRYQYIKSKIRNTDAPDDVDLPDWMDDRLYGVFMSVMFVL
ncbi:MAG TPA: hypothetical protein PK253_19340 [Spirochaetota bacterium]|nr:hypothetical protein [Spirochaetota bacterium]